ncbi:hypothetical protein [Paludisphaera soli]|uniref:hypothetical protein n=1 Tax=Paludisphaera soli TaxID=2712865 RepID=UPI0013EAE67C|nr:hypothetical protein [Paludisphaera soli]
MADVRAFYRSIRGSLGAAAALLFWDVVMTGSFLMSMIFCPIWILISLLKSTIQLPGRRLALARVGIPVATLAIVWANDAVQLRIAEANARRVVAACEAYHVDEGRFPRKLEELAPRYLESVPLAKHCMMGGFFYSNSQGGKPMLFWVVVPPYLRKIYHFDTRTWSYLD